MGTPVLPSSDRNGSVVYLSTSDILVRETLAGDTSRSERRRVSRSDNCDECIGHGREQRGARNQRAKIRIQTDIMSGPYYVTCETGRWNRHEGITGATLASTMVSSKFTHGVRSASFTEEDLKQVDLRARDVTSIIHREISFR